MAKYENGSWTGKTDKFYQGKSWRALRNIHIEANPLDELKEQYGIIEPAVLVDHIIPREVCPELELCKFNLQSLSFNSHQQKTATTRGYSDLIEFIRHLHRGKLQYICTEDRKKKLLDHLKEKGLC